MDSNQHILASAIFFLSGLMMVRLLRRAFGTYSSPAGLYVGLWFFSLGVFYTGLVYYYDLDLQTVLIFLCTIIVFVLGSFGAKFAFRGKSARIFKMHPVDSQIRTLIYLLFSIGSVGFIGYYHRLDQLIGISAIWNNPRLVRYQESIGDLKSSGTIGLAYSLLTPCFVLCIIYLGIADYPNKRMVKAISFLACCLTLVSSARTTTIGLVLWAGLASWYLANTYGTSLTLGKYKFQLLTGGIVVGAYFITTTSLLQKGIDFNTSSASVNYLPSSLSGLVDVIHYAVSGFPAFQMLSKTVTHVLSGPSLTFGFLARFLHEALPNNFTAPEYVQPFVNVPLSTNLYTYLDSFYLDFGLVGVVFFPFLLGFITTGLYLWMRTSPSIAKVYLTSLMGLCIMQSTISNRFGTFLIFMWIVIPLALLKMISILYLEQSSHRFIRPLQQPRSLKNYK